MGNRDLVRAWEAALSGYPLAYSEGRRRSPQIALAAPLPVGVTSDCELVDIFLEEAVDPSSVLTAVPARLPEGIEPLAVTEVGVDGPSLQSLLRCAEYEVTLPAGAVKVDVLRSRIDDLLAAGSRPVEYRRGEKVKNYDLRPLVLAVEMETVGEALVIRMHLRAEQDRSARADQVLLALGIEAQARIHRTRLELDEVPAALQAYRRAREPTGSELQ
jgi:radical SAM-linked protein